ncbi:aminotransferase class V-fold PLP-dependent enzyme [Fulvivirgaceae bacterium BMA12]|uniref:Aminotransferase class V-fold PLP-dependent enzyme n=1 Tax=Agaribacillus aureus TaxID=3051825 RepID=A0ABT8L0Q9_9BACT|nr:aminotransferase class V-fold PLP-dependent enzyme [Fulvivirgaceae bacterium BMA12]
MLCQKDHFSIPDHVTYLNCAYMSPQLKTVMDAGIEAAHIKNYPFQIKAEDFFNATTLLRQTFSKLIGNPDPDRIAVIPSVSYGMAIVSKNLNLQAGEEILLTHEQFPSNFYPWQKLACEKKGRLVIVEAPNEDDRGKKWNEKILENINEKTKLVTIGNVHWADGTKFDLKAIRQRTSEVGALLVVDGTQSVGALPFDVGDIQPDALVCSGYKWLLGPYSMAFAYFGSFFDDGDPIEENWINRHNSEDFAGLVAYESNYKEKALRYAVGEHSNFSLTPMMQKALEQLNEWGASNIQQYCSQLTKAPIAELLSLGFRIENENYRGSHLIGIRVPDHLDVKALSNQFKKHDVYISVRGNAIRVAPHVYNDQNDMDKLVEIIKKAAL